MVLNTAPLARQQADTGAVTKRIRRWTASTCRSQWRRLLGSALETHRPGGARFGYRDAGGFLVDDAGVADEGGDESVDGEVVNRTRVAA